MATPAYRDSEDLSRGERVTLRILSATERPLSTAEISQRFEPTPEREDRVWEYVHDLERRGLVERVWRPYGGKLRWAVSGGHAVSR
jgi:hypothetical protein